MSIRSQTGPRSNNSFRTNSGQLLRATAQQSLQKNSLGNGFGIQSKTNIDPKNSVIVGLDELQRIKQQCTMASKEDQEQRTQDRFQLHQKSQARVKNWPNTIEALRKKKEDDRIKRLEQEEIEKRKIDAIEYEHQMQQKQQAVERANKQMHDSQDQVKAFHSKLQMCDVLDEREYQIQMKKQKQQVQKQIEQQWYEFENQKMNEYDEQLRQKLMEEYNKKAENAKVIKEQLLEYKKNFIKRFQEEQLEGELIRRQAEEEQKKEKQREYERKLKQQEQKEQFKKANEDLMKHMQEEKKKEQIEEEKINVYAKQKERMEKQRKDKEEQKFQQKQQTRQKLIERQIENLKNMKNKEDEILNKQVAEAEEKAYKLFEEQQRRRQQLKDGIEKSRRQQYEKKEMERQLQKQEEQEFCEFWKIRSEELQIAEQQEKEEERQRNVELKNYLKKQKEEKEKQAVEEYKKELESQAKSQALLDQQEKSFYSYAEQCLKEWQDNGKNVKPLILELKGYKKRLVS